MDRDVLIREREYSSIVREIDCRLTELELKEKYALSRKEYENEIQRLEKTIRVFQELKIFDSLEVWNYNERIQKIKVQRELMHRKTTLCIVDDFENSRERAIHYREQEEKNVHQSRCRREWER